MYRDHGDEIFDVGFDYGHTFQEQNIMREFIRGITKRAGKYIRHAIGVGVGLAATYLAARWGFVLEPEEQAALVVLGYGMTEKLLKRVRLLDPEGWAEREWAQQAASRMAHMPKDVAANKIRLGGV